MTKTEQKLIDLCDDLIEAVDIVDYELACKFTLRLNTIWEELTDVD